MIKDYVLSKKTDRVKKYLGSEGYLEFVEIGYCDETNEQISDTKVEKELYDRLCNGLYVKYGEGFEQSLMRRVECEFWFAGIFRLSDRILAFHDLAMFLKERKIPYRTTGTTSSAFIFYLLEISFVNPLPPHYHCQNCHSFIWDKSCKDGFDLPARKCDCGEYYVRDGHDLPLETFWGFELSDEATEHVVGLIIPESAHQTAHNFLLNHPLLRHLELRQYIRSSDYYRYDIIELRTEYWPAESASWHEPLPPEKIMRVMAKLYKEHGSPILKAEYNPDTFYGLVKATEMCLNAGKYLSKGEAIVMDGLATVEELPTSCDDLYELFADKLTKKDIWRASVSLLKGNGIAPHAREMIEEEWLADYLSGHMYPKACNLEWMVAETKILLIQEGTLNAETT